MLGEKRQQNGAEGDRTPAGFSPDVGSGPRPDYFLGEGDSAFFHSATAPCITSIALQSVTGWQAVPSTPDALVVLSLGPRV